MTPRHHRCPKCRIIVGRNSEVGEQRVPRSRQGIVRRSRPVREPATDGRLPSRGLAPAPCGQQGVAVIASTEAGSYRQDLSSLDRAVAGVVENTQIGPPGPWRLGTHV